EADLHRDLAAAPADPDLVSHGLLEALGGVAHSSLLLGVHRPVPVPRPLSWLAGQPGPSLRLAAGPAVARGGAGEAAAGVVAADQQHRAAVALAQLAALEQRERLVR